MPINQSICFGGFSRGRDPIEVIKKSAEIGYKSIEMLPAEYWSVVQDHGMRVAIIVRTRLTSVRIKRSEQPRPD